MSFTKRANRFFTIKITQTYELPILKPNLDCNFPSSYTKYDCYIGKC